MVAGFESVIVSFVALQERPIVSHDGMGMVVTSRRCSEYQLHPLL